MLNELEKVSLVNYEKRLALPKWKYILLFGIIGWGLPVAIIVTIINMFTDKKSLAYMLQGELWINLMGFTVGGIAFGLVTRMFIRKKYLKLKDKEQLPE
ncbi:MAG: hypothetical protein Q8941_03115 [Bacteroidota bacterium]|nr:hypothetical protein [Bacteroidota bacterium]